MDQAQDRPRHKRGLKLNILQFIKLIYHRLTDRKYNTITLKQKQIFIEKSNRKKLHPPLMKYT
jgi:hypothetical protein